MHGCVDGVGYCMEGQGDWCKCTVKGKTYEQEIEMLKTIKNIQLVTLILLDVG